MLAFAFILLSTGLVLLAPFRQRSERVVEVGAGLCDRIFDAGWYLMKNLPVNHSVGFHLSQVLDQHLFTNFRDKPFQLTETAGLGLMDLPEQQRLPLAADNCKRRTQSTTVGQISLFSCQ